MLFWADGGYLQEYSFDVLGPLVRDAVPQTLIAERQPHGLIVSTHH